MAAPILGPGAYSIPEYTPKESRLAGEKLIKLKTSIANPMSRRLRRDPLIDGYSSPASLPSAFSVFSAPA